MAPKLSKMSTEELLSLRPERKSRAKAKATMSPEERNWQRGETSELGAFLWHCRIGDLKLIGHDILRIPNFSDVKTRTAAIELIYATLTDEHDPSAASSSTGGQTKAPPEATEVIRVPP
jgi:hypothetical protein